MTKEVSIRRSLLLLILLVSSSAAAAQQQTQQPFNYAFVSPNTRENLKIDDAIKQMNSTEEARLRSKAINLGCVVRSRIHAQKALGMWSDGAEHSVLLRFRSDEETLRYVMSRMGRDAQQKYVIYFYPYAGGPDDLYILSIRKRNLVALSNELERAGIPFRTLVPSRGTTAVYIIDLERELRDKILAAARQLRAQVNFQSGNGDLFGADLRQNARAKFEEEIKNYETKNPNLPPPCNAKRNHRSRR